MIHVLSTLNARNIRFIHKKWRRFHKMMWFSRNEGTLYMEAVIVTVVENAELAALVASAVVGEVSRTGFKKIGILSLSSSH